MNSELLVMVTVYSGLLGLSCWFIGLSDHLYRLGLRRTRRSKMYDRIDNAFIAIGSVCVAGFVIGLYTLASKTL